MQLIFSWLAIIVGVVAAYLWYHSASIDIPVSNIKSGWGALTGVEEVTAAFQLAATWNARAAIATAVAVLFQALSLTPPAVSEAIILGVKKAFSGAP